MKLKMTIKLAVITLVALFAFSNCESSKAGDNSDKNNQLLLALLNRTTTNSAGRLACNSAVTRMNQCIGAGSGFNPAVMCSDTNIQKDGTYSDSSTTPATTVTYTSVDVYTRLSSCIDTQIAATNCNFSQNKVASPNQAKAAFFSTCEADYTSTSITAAVKATKAPTGTIITVF